MNYKVGMTGTTQFGDGTTARIEILKIQTYPSSGMPADIVFKYADDETNRKLVNPNLEKSLGYPKDTFHIPEGMVPMIFTPNGEEKVDKTSETDEFEVLLEKHLEEEYDPENRPEAREIYRKLVNLHGIRGEDGKKIVIEKYFNTVNEQ